MKESAKGRFFEKAKKEDVGTDNILVESSSTSSTDSNEKSVYQLLTLGSLDIVRREDKQDCDKKKKAQLKCMECGKLYYDKKRIKNTFYGSCGRKTISLH